MPARLKQFEVTGLFGQLDHTVPLNIDDHITGIVAPNGLGKTVCLKLIEAIFNRKYTAFRDTIFRDLTFTFTSGEKILVHRRPAKPVRENQEEPDKRVEVELKYISPEGASASWKATRLAVPPGRYDFIDRYVPQVTRRGPEIWTDDFTGEELTAEDVVERYSSELPERFASVRVGNEPSGYRDLVSPIECHLIETQRLLSLTSPTVRRSIYADAPTGRRQESRLAVTQKAEKLSEILRGTLTEYANLSQTLDRSFPRRVVENRGPGTLSQQEIQEQLNALDEKRKKLMTAGILDTSFEPVAIPFAELEKDVAKVLEIYIDDTSKKLQKFDALLNRVSLLQKLINQRFLNKTIRIERKTGYSLVSDRGSTIPLNKLSSGEQHRLILLFELLFEVKQHSLILIDEPELSLHVSWQKGFLEDIDQIIKLNNFDVVLATHSPQLMGRRYNLAVELAPVD